MYISLLKDKKIDPVYKAGPRLVSVFYCYPVLRLYDAVSDTAIAAIGD